MTYNHTMPIQTQQLQPAQRIIHVVKLIPQGKVLPYGKVADLAGLPGRARYVSTALKQSKDGQVPWHRVISASGKLAFPPDSALFRIQTELLWNDNVEVNQGKVNLSTDMWQPDIATLVLSLPF
ncbi:MGMT family protein [Shewanella gaetbuli]|uniref:MGMT family protein n=1 Tax=Shewanella gaetbuli TaxID=220752 RepID=A0A9X2CK01_9GAMM|nr:MGMT family protein [Shewanella gaetbuli]MCL1142591.1 MGMT family protein [Shewanella gaetbuli]